MLQRCRGGSVDVDALLSDPVAREEAQRLGPMMWDLADYAACRDLAGGKLTCEVFGSGEFAEKCRGVASSARFARTILKDGDAMADCLRAPLSPGLKPDSVGRVCSAFVTGIKEGRPEQVCDALEKEGVKGGGEICAQHQVFWKGRAEDCSGLKDAAIQHECLVLAPLAAGLRTPALCKDSPLCGALTGRGTRSCDVYKTALSRAVCAQAAKVLPAFEEANAWKRQESAAAAQKVKEERAKAAELKLLERAKARAESGKKKQFHEGQPMRQGDSAVEEAMRRLERGEPAASSATIKTRGTDAKK